MSSRGTIFTSLVVKLTWATMPQMAIEAHRQRPAILVSKPAAYGRDVHARLDTGSRKKVPQPMMREAWEAQFAAGRFQAIPGEACLTILSSKCAVGFSRRNASNRSRSGPDIGEERKGRDIITAHGIFGHFPLNRHCHPCSV